MAKILLILGNGFDIDFGLKTRYSDFANHPIWDNLMNESHAFDQDLLGTLKSAKETEAWFDIEKTMNDYVRALPPAILITDRVNKDKKDFINISEALSTYLKKEQTERKLNINCYAAKVLELISNVGGFNCYT